MAKRIQRVNELIKKEISQIILREVEFPKNVFVTVTRVETSPNLIESKVFISVLSEQDKSTVFTLLNRQIYALQQGINKRLRMRPIPKILFSEETRTVEAGKIEALLEKLKKEQK